VNREFKADSPDRLWVTDITQHRTSEGWVYCAAVIDVFSRRVGGWSIADHLRTELVVDALEMARMRRKPVGTVLHSDRGTQYTSWFFGHRAARGRPARVDGPGRLRLRQRAHGVVLGIDADRAPGPPLLVDPGRAGQCDVLDRSLLQPVRRHSGLDYRSPVEFEYLHKAANPAA
jgi:putative transposase